MSLQESAKNVGLTAAKKAKDDEFYTQYIDIQMEVEAYLEYDPDTFRDKIVYCNCDDPFESNFFKYFAVNFNRLGLRKLITTSYHGSSIAGAQISFEEYMAGNGTRQKPRATCVEIEEVTDLNGDGVVGIEDVKFFLENNPYSHRPLAGGGDFRSAECVELLQQADIVVTNPPFSLFKEYMALLEKYEKKLLVIGNLNAITYRETFPRIKEDRLWLGATIHGGDREFRVPDHAEIKSDVYRTDDKGRRYVSVPGIRWYTNLDHGRRHEVLPLMSMQDNLRFNTKLASKPAYKRYENYEAIEIPYTDAIPVDYIGVMGVPITFLDKYNPDQFEILGTTGSNAPDNAFRTRFYSREECKDAYMNRFGREGSYDLNAAGVINGAKIYQRILIRPRDEVRP